MPEIYNKKCKTCGSTYLITKHKLAMRDKDEITCDVCGEELLSWNGGVTYSAKLIERTNWQKPTSSI